MPHRARWLRPRAARSAGLSLWPDVVLEAADGGVKRVDLDRLTRAEVASWTPGQKLLLSGSMLTGRDAAHLRMTRMLAAGEPLPVNLKDRRDLLCRPGGPGGRRGGGAGGTDHFHRMDRYTDAILGNGLLAMVGKAERGPEAIAAIARHKAAYLIAVGGAAYLVSKAIKAARVVAFEDLGMERL